MEELMMKYHVTCKVPNETGFWYTIDAKSLRGAKAIATKMLGDGFRSGCLHVASEHDNSSPGCKTIIASRWLTDKRWRSV